MVVVVSVLLGLFPLMVLVDGEPRTARGDGGCDLFLDPVRPCVLGILFGLVLLVHGVCSRGGGAELGQLLHVLVVLLLLAPIAGAGGLLGLVLLVVLVVTHCYSR